MAKGKKKQLSLEEMLEEAIVKEEDRPYEVPGNWVWTTLEHIVEIRTGKEDANFANENGRYNFFTCAELPLKCDLAAFSGESILIAGNGMFHVNYFDGDFNAYQRTYVIQKFRAALGKYLYYFIIRSIEEITKNNRGSTIQYIRLGDLTNAKIAIPPILEQQRIVGIIETLFEKLDTAKELVQNAFDSFESRKSAILHKAFTGELTAKWREENGVSLDCWNKPKAREICDFITKGETPTKFVSAKGEIPFLKVYNIRENKLDFAYNSAFIPKEIHNGKMKRSRVFPGDVIMNIVGPPLQKVAVVTNEYDEWNINQAIAIFRPKEKINTRYLYYCLLCEDTLADVLEGVRGVVGQSNISLEQCRDLNIPLPSLPEQQEIVRILDNLLEKEQHAKELSDVIEKIDLMKKAILARAFRGELGTNNSEEESVLGLLD